MWVPAVAAWTLAWNRWCPRPWRSIDVSAVVLAVAGNCRRRDPFGERDKRQPARVDRAVCRDRRAHRPQRTNADPGARHVSVHYRRVFGGELLDPIGVPGIWFPFGIGVSRTQYVYAIVIPLLAFLIVQTLPEKNNETLRD